MAVEESEHLSSAASRLSGEFNFAALAITEQQRTHLEGQLRDLAIELGSARHAAAQGQADVAALQAELAAQVGCTLAAT